MTRRLKLGLALPLAAAVAVAYVTLVEPYAPAGQPPLATIDAAAVAAIRADFNASADKVRIFVLLSPT